MATASEPRRGAMAGKRCLVTGSTHGARRLPRRATTAGLTPGAGIGLATARELLAQGASLVWVCSRKQGNVDEAVAALSREFPTAAVRGTACNVGDAKSLEALVRAVSAFTPTLDVFVSNVGVDPVSGKALEMPESVFDKIFSTNVKSAWALLKLLRPMLVRGSSVVLVASTGGLQPATPSGLYGASKAALIGLGRALSTELGPDGIRVNAVAPGLVRTRMSEAFWKGPYAAAAEASVSLRRLGEPADVAAVVAFLCSDAAGWVTGETVAVSGGIGTRL